MSYAYFSDTRNRLFDQQLGRGLPAIGQMRYSTMSIFTESPPQSKSYMHSFGDESILNSIHKLSNPLKKNLADTLAHTADTMTDNVPKMAEVNKNKQESAPNMLTDSENRRENTFFGITSFFSGIVNVLSGNIFNRRAKSPPAYHECCDYESECETLSSVGAWRLANCADQNKNVRAHERSDSPPVEITKQAANMTEECHAAAEQCQDKINKVRLMLSKKTLNSPKKCQPRRPKKVFVEPNSIENSFQEDFLCDHIETLPNTAQTEFSSPCVVHEQELLQTDSPIIKTDTMPVHGKLEIVKTLDNTARPADKLATVANTTVININSVDNNSADSSPESVKDVQTRSPKCKARITPAHRPKDKHFKNPHRLNCTKRSQAQVKRQIEEDMHFADEIDADNLSNLSSSIENIAPVGTSASSSSDHQTDDSDVFDEIEGCFHSKLDCKDSFQIVFTDIPKFRTRKPSDCESEDSFIVFEESPNNCYTTDDVFVEEDEDSDETSDEESEYEGSDDEPSFSAGMSHLSRSVGDLTDESLYEAKSEDQVDCTTRFNVPEIDSSIVSGADIESSGVLLTDAKKRFKKNLPPKKVQFSPHPPQVRVMRVWAFAAGQARIGHWEQYGRDRERFKRRIADVDMAVSWVLKPQHRSRVMFQRFMPWWNQQKRRELAEKRKEEERRREIENQQAITESAALNENTDNCDYNCVGGVKGLNIEENCISEGENDENNGTRVGSDDEILAESIEHGRELDKETLHNETNSSMDDAKEKECESILGANKTAVKCANLNGLIDNARGEKSERLLGHDTADTDDVNTVPDVVNNCDSMKTTTQICGNTLKNSNDHKKTRETKKDINNRDGKLHIVEYKSADTDKNGLKSINKALINGSLGLKENNKVVI